MPPRARLAAAVFFWPKRRSEHWGEILRQNCKKPSGKATTVF